MDATTTTAGEERTIVPRWMVASIVAILTLLLVADVMGQFIVPGHSASPLFDGAILTLLGGVIAASRGPQPPKPDDPPPAAEPPPQPPLDPPPAPPPPPQPEPPPPAPPPGRHHYSPIEAFA